MRFFTSDTHFGHANIIKYCNRPFNDVDHMNEVIISNWNSVVSPDDEVFHLGDVALGPWEKWDSILTRLNGFKTLVVGNHDRIFRGEKPKMRERFESQYASWFDVVTDEIKNFRVGNSMVNMSHFPYDGDSHGEDRHSEFRLEDRGSILIHGHTHLDTIISYSNANTLQIHVGQDAFDYYPVSESQVINLIESQRQEP